MSDRITISYSKILDSILDSTTNIKKRGYVRRQKEKNREFVHTLLKKCLDVAVAGQSVATINAQEPGKIVELSTNEYYNKKVDDILSLHFHVHEDAIVGLNYIVRESKDMLKNLYYGECKRFPPLTKKEEQTSIFSTELVTPEGNIGRIFGFGYKLNREKTKCVGVHFCVSYEKPVGTYYYLSSHSVGETVDEIIFGRQGAHVRGFYCDPEIACYFPLFSL